MLELDAWRNITLILLELNFVKTCKSAVEDWRIIEVQINKYRIISSVE